MIAPRTSVIEAARRIVAEKLRTLPFLTPEMVLEVKAGNTEAKFYETLAKTDLCVLVGIEPMENEPYALVFTDY